MSDPLTFPGRIHVETIRRELWRPREFGRAAVMVGAGFSRNAEPSGAATGPFPLWREIGQRLYEELYPPGCRSDREAHRAIVAAGTGSIRLAGEYETAFGRNRLDDLLQDVVPDASFDPGRMHRLLLELPWADVFTTNYDTLLERTRRLVHFRRYGLVQTAEDIPAGMRPRIVKLHGSFPSHRPFVLTEEDYRTYPTRAAPLVNMVQQSIMENVFCLLGFSGDDANFLFWSGWVRDNLRVAAPRVYLCGLLDHTEVQRQLLDRRNVVPVDLAPLFPSTDWPDADVRHTKALEWLLLSLHRGQPANPVHWPGGGLPPTEAPSAGLPALLPPPHPPVEPGPLHPNIHPPGAGTP